MVDSIPDNSSYINRSCVVCSSRHLHYAFPIGDYRVVRCDECNLMTINPQPSDSVLGKIYSGDYFILSSNKDGISHVESLKKATADTYLDILLDKASSSASLLEIGCGSGDLLSQAVKRGLKVIGVEYSQHACETARIKLGNNGDIVQGDISLLAGEKERFDYIVFCDVLEHVRDPRAFLKIVYDLLKPDGSILVVAPSIDSWSAKLLNTNWMEYKLEHLFYFNTKNLRSLLFQEGFTEISHFPARKTLSLDYIAGHFVKHPVPFWSKLMKIACAILPQRLLRRPFQITASGIGMLAKKRVKDVNHVLSVIMPAYNEVKTIKDGIDRVLRKKLLGVEIELIVIESNSNDGTREIVSQYNSHPRVKIIYEEKPCGKGHAVREGLKAATGEFILIQDADDEYDIEDYDALIEPLLDGREAFILGARHGSSKWKMRKFRDQPFRAFLLNSGHIFFATLVNLFCGVWLRDPFTMYKVFRRDCIQNITFESNRFDFDYELLIKLIRKGFKPLEIPVCYRSRSFAEGKKVRIIRDPINWLKAIVKYRFSKI